MSTEGEQRLDDHLDVWTFGRMDVSDAPDLTRAIMGRLGYMRVPPQVSRRHRIGRWMTRCMLIAFAGVAVTLGIKAYQASPEARRPAAVTIPMAVTQDFQQHQVRFGAVLRLLQEVPVRFDDNGAGEAQDDFRGLPVDVEGDPNEIDDEVNRSAIAPVRWV